MSDYFKSREQNAFIIFLGLVVRENKTLTSALEQADINLKNKKMSVPSKVYDALIVDKST